MPSSTHRLRSTFGDSLCNSVKWPMLPRVHREGITQAYIDQAVDNLKYPDVAVEVIKGVRLS